MDGQTHKPVLIVIAGPNGAGKTTITNQVLKHEWIEGAVYINPDVVAKERFGDWNSLEAVLQSAKYCQEIRERLLHEKKSLAFETVMSTADKLDFMKRAKQNGYFVRVFFVATDSPLINVNRVAKRVLSGGHDVPITKIIKRYYSSIINCKLAIDIADRVYVYDNSVDGCDAQLLFRTAEGRLKKVYNDNLPEWAKAIVPSVG